MLLREGPEDLFDLVIELDVVVEEFLLQNVIQRQDGAVSDEDEVLQEHKACEDVAVRLDSLVEHIVQLIVCEYPRLADRLGVLEAMFDSSDSWAILNASLISDVLSMHEGLIERYLYVIGFEFLIEVRVLREALHPIVVEVNDSRLADSSSSRFSVILEYKLELYNLVEAWHLLRDDWAVLPELVVEILVPRPCQHVEGVQIYLIGVVLEGNQDAAIFVSLAALKDLVRRHLIANVEAMNSDGPKGALVKDFLHLDGWHLRLVRLDQAGVSLTALWE